MNVKKFANISVLLSLPAITFIFLYHMRFITNFKSISKKTYVNVSDKEDNKYKFKSLEEIHFMIKQQIYSLQEEGSCEEKKVLICRNVLTVCGFGSNVHRYGVCMQVAYGLGRMFFIEQDEYSHFDGVFQWVKPESVKCGYLKKKYSLDKSQTCNAQDPACYLSNGYDINNDHRVIEFNTMKATFPYPRQLPGTIPEVLEKNLLHLGIQSPWLWFTSQFLAYLLLRPNDRFNATFSAMKEQINYTLPIDGFHIRHGDKLTTGEAEYVSESVFTKNANDYFNEYNVSYKRVYIATDDIPAIKVVQTLAPELFITGLPQSYLSKSLGNYFQKNFPKEIVESTLLDLYFLSNADCLVCDITSNLCRLAYELKQGVFPFKQSNILKPVGKEKDVYYRWFDFVYPFSLWIYLKNKMSPNLNDVNKGFQSVLMSDSVYSDGLYIKVEKIQTNLTEVWRMKKIVNVIKQGLDYIFDGSEFKYVNKNDLMEWPGRPPYYYFTRN